MRVWVCAQMLPEVRGITSLWSLSYRQVWKADGVLELDLGPLGEQQATLSTTEPALQPQGIGIWRFWSLDRFILLALHFINASAGLSKERN